MCTIYTQNERVCTLEVKMVGFEYLCNFARFSYSLKKYTTCNKCRNIPTILFNIVMYIVYIMNSLVVSVCKIDTITPRNSQRLLTR